MDTLSLRPLGIPEIIDAAIKLLRRHAKTLFTISAVVLIPLGIVEFLLAQRLGDLANPGFIPSTADPEIILDLLVGILVAALVTAIIALLAQLVVQLGSIKAISDVYLDRTPDWRSSLIFGLRRLPSALGSVVIASIPLILGFILCLVPGIWLATTWSMTGAVIVAEEKGPVGALGRSFNMVMKRFWPVLGVLALAFLVIFVVQFVVTGIAGATVLSGQTIPFGLQAVLDTAVNILVVPFTAAVLAVLYFDLRVRQEGFDLEKMAAALGSGPPSPPPSLPPRGEVPARPEAPRPDDPFGLGQPGGS